MNCECQYVSEVASRSTFDDATKLWSDSSQSPVMRCSKSATRKPFLNAWNASRSATPRV